MTNPNPITSIAAAIAAQLGETQPGARSQIWRTVRVLGAERTQAFVAQALEAEVNGGLLLPSAARGATVKWSGATTLNPVVVGVVGGCAAAHNLLTCQHASTPVADFARQSRYPPRSE